MTPSREAAASFGARLRGKRLGVGLSQTDLAGENLSASYISLLEAGKRTATLDVVKVLAERLDCTPEYLLHGEDPDVTRRVTVAMTYADLALRNGEAAEALSQLDRLTADHPQIPARLQAQVQAVRAKALEAVGRLEEAAACFEELARRARAEGDWQVHLERVVDLVRCYQAAGDVNHSLELAAEALDSVSSLHLEGSDVHARLASTLVSAYYVRGDLTKAAVTAREAIDAIEGRGSPRARGCVLWNASRVEDAKGNLGEALLLAEKALALFSDGDDARAVARLQVAYGWLLLRSDPPNVAEATRVLGQAQAALTDVGSATDVANCETELARAALMAGLASEALVLAEDAWSRYAGVVRLETASTQLVRAAALLALDRKPEALAEYRGAAVTLGQLEVSRQAAAAWRELADAYTGLSMFQDAALAYQQALTEVGVGPAPGIATEPPPPQTGHGIAAQRGNNNN